MSKRRWTNIQVSKPQILAMRETGMRRRMIADELGLELHKQEKQIKTKLSYLGPLFI